MPISFFPFPVEIIVPSVSNSMGNWQLEIGNSIHLLGAVDPLLYAALK
jgi:hypothetical protein